MVVKKGGSREPYDRNKVLGGLRRACEKRPISVAQLEFIADQIEKVVQDSSDREVQTNEIGKIIMRRLKALDKVAYVRFASVYLEFEDVSEFMSELKTLVHSNAARSKPKKQKAKNRARH
jgi:transcriptional repressor NrdR